MFNSTQNPISPADLERQSLADGRQGGPVRPRVVILGGGFAGLAAARALRRQPVTITLIDRQNHHLFQPLLYQVATAALAPSDVAVPIRGLFRGRANVTVVMDTVSAINCDERIVRGRRTVYPYDHLIVATGVEYTYFGHDGWAAEAPAIKTLADAIAIRRKVLMAFERAETDPDPAERCRLTTFAVVGGGPTGVEMAGALAELARKVLVRDFRRVEPRRALIYLLEAGPTLLAGFDPRLAEYARRVLERKGVIVRLNSAVSAIGQGRVVAGEDVLVTENVFWAAGVWAPRLSEWLGPWLGRAADHPRATDRQGRVVVGPRLGLPDHPDVFVIGDAAHCDQDGEALPGVAPVARQQGKYVGRVIAAAVRGRPPPAPFRYHSPGMLATIGRGAAVADLRRVRLTGWLAWLLWGLVHIYSLIGFRNRMAVFLNWAWAYLTYGLSARVVIANGALERNRDSQCQRERTE